LQAVAGDGAVSHIKKQVSRADQAFFAHSAILKAELVDRALQDNPFWTMLKQDAYERFCNELGGKK
jgi:hypothetical protein